MKRFALPALILIALPLSGSTQAPLTDYEVNYLRNALPAVERSIQSLEKELTESNRRIAALERRLNDLEGRGQKTSP